MWIVADKTMPVRRIDHELSNGKLALRVHCTDTAAARDCIETLRQLDPYCGLARASINMSIGIRASQLGACLAENGLIDDACKLEMSGPRLAWRTDKPHANGAIKGPHRRFN